jgi:thiopeptide-type bacteriocin biosynthesis protein
MSESLQKRNYIIGDEWFYLKIYCGYKTTDIIISQIIYPLAKLLYEEKAIKKWFFIRYADPDNHLRIRFQITEQQIILSIIKQLNKELGWYFENDLVYKVQIDTYQQEIERYGANTVHLAEEFFFFDSVMIAEMLQLLDGDLGEENRWLFALRAEDAFLSKFNPDLSAKLKLVEMFHANYSKEFNMNRALKDQLDAKFRKERAKINLILQKDHPIPDNLSSLIKIIDKKSLSIEPTIKTLIDYNENKKLQVSLQDLIGSYIHMMINRIFKSKQRLHEFVLYDFLFRFYKSEIAKQKKLSSALP